MIGTEAQDTFISEMRQAIVTTLRRDGSPSSSLIAYARVGDQLLFSTTRDRLKAKTLVRDPRIVVAILDDAGKGRFVSVEGQATVKTGDVVDGHIELNRQMRRDPDWRPPEDFADRLARDGRVLIYVTPQRISGMLGR